MNDYTQSQATLQDELNELDRIKAQQSVDNTAFSYYQDEDNLIKWQLEVNDIIDTLYHLLRGDSIKIEKGNRVWKDCAKDQMPLSEEGVQNVLREVYNYIQKNLLLSNYDKEQIDMRVFTFGDYFADMIMDSYEAIGMDTETKQERYSLIVLSTVNQIDSAYRRALGGKERDSLTKKTMVHQSLNPMQSMGQHQNKKSALSYLNPKNWF